MATNPMALVSFEEYLEAEQRAQSRSEYWNGQVNAMAGGTGRHSAIMSNLTGALWNATRGKRCQVHGSDLLVQPYPGGLTTYPDVMLVCGPANYLDARQLVITNPLLVAEVLSPSTENYDRGRKATEYWKSATLRVLLIVSQVEPLIQVQTKLPDGSRIVVDVAGIDGVVRIAPLDCEIALSDIYDGVEFGAV